MRSAAKIRCEILALALAVAALAAAGCASTPYADGDRESYYRSKKLAALDEPQIERGKPRPIIDGVGWVMGIPGKIILWDRRNDNHHITDGTQVAVSRYLAANELDDVKVRLNQYAPVKEWRRLVANDAVGPGWRYTLGTLTWVGYTLLPGRIFGGDNYNPFTNTVHIYSDVPATALHEGGHAKDFARRKYKGTYAAVYALLPGAPLWHERLATKDALGYLREHGTLEEEREGYEILYPAYGTYVGSTAASFVPGPGYAVQGAAIVGGHVIGRMRSAKLSDERPEQPRHPWRDAAPTEASVDPHGKTIPTGETRNQPSPPPGQPGSTGPAFPASAAPH